MPDTPDSQTGDVPALEPGVAENFSAPSSEKPLPDVAADSPIALAVDAWFDAEIKGSIVGHDTQIYNHVRVAVANLKKRLAAL